MEGSVIEGAEVGMICPSGNDDDADEAPIGGAGERVGEGLALVWRGEADYFVEEWEGDSLVTVRLSKKCIKELTHPEFPAYE